MKHLIPIVVMVVGLVGIMFWRGCQPSEKTDYRHKYDSVQVLYDARQVVEQERAERIDSLEGELVRKEATNAALEDEVEQLRYKVKQGRKKNVQPVQRGDTAKFAGVLLTEQQWDNEKHVQEQQADLIDSLRATMKVMSDLIGFQREQLTDYEIDKQELVFQKELLQDEVVRLDKWYRKPKVIVPVAVAVGILTVIVAK